MGATIHIYVYTEREREREYVLYTLYNVAESA